MNTTTVIRHKPRPGVRDEVRFQATCDCGWSARRWAGRALGRELAEGEAIEHARDFSHSVVVS